MTNEEAKDKLNFLKTPLDEVYKSMIEALDMAIKALAQEPCEDAISRDELLKAIDTWDKFGCDANTKLVPYQDHYIPYIHYDDVIKCIKGLPPVTPQPKIGHWIDMGDFEKCSACNGTHLKEFQNFYGKGIWVKTNYCPNCGAKMEVEE